MFCPSCGAQNDDGNKFCMSCGAGLASGAAQPAQQPPPQPQQPAAPAVPDGLKLEEPPLQQPSQMGFQGADVIDYRVYGEEMQLVEIELDPGESVQAEVGAFVYMDDGIEMQTSTGGGFFSGLKRMVSGESFFITSFTNNGQGKAHAAFTAPFPSQIIPLDLAALGGSFICQKDSFLCAAKGVEVQVAFTKKIGAGFFGGEGFILQQLSGNGMAFINAGGAIVQKVLQAGETLRVDTGCLVGMSPSVNYDIQFVGGFKNALFGGEGFFNAHLSGPGVVYLQSLPFSRLVDRIVSAMPKSSGGGFTFDSD